MLLNEAEQKRKQSIRIMAFLFVFMAITAMLVLSTSVSAAELSDPIDGEKPWGWPLEGLYNSMRNMFYKLICSILDGAFGLIDGVVATANTELSKTPSSYNSTVFNLMTTVSHNVIIPIATVILSYVVIYDLITMLMEKNNFHDFDTSLFFRWLLKTGVALLFLSNADTIVNAFFDLGSVIVSNLNSTSSAVTGTMSDASAELGEQLTMFGIGTYISMLIPALLLDLVSIIIYVCVYVILIGRMIEIYIHLSIAPIPLATITSHEIGDMGKNYLKTIFAFILQAFFIFLCIVIYKSLIFSLVDKIGSITLSDNPDGAAWNISGYMFQIVAYGVVLVLTMFKTNSIAKSVVGAH